MMDRVTHVNRVNFLDPCAVNTAVSLGASEGLVLSVLIKPVHELLLHQVETDANRLVFSDVRRTVTYGDFFMRTGNIAAHLAVNGLASGGRVAIILGNRVEMLEAFYAVLRAGAVVVPVNPSLTPAEVHYQLTDSGADWVVTDSDRLPALIPVLRKLPSLRLLLVDPADDAAFDELSEIGTLTIAFDNAACTSPGVEARDNSGLDDVAFLLYTSGTTGRPKGVLSTLRSCLLSVANGYIEVFGLNADDRMLWPLPLFHSLAHIFANLGTVMAGAHTHLLEGFSTEAVLDALAQREYTVLVGVPAMYHYLADAAQTTTSPNLAALRACLSAGAPMSAAMRERFTRILAAPMVDSYGSTETCGPITMSRPGDETVPESCGPVVAGLSVRIIDVDTGNELPRGGEGEVWVRGPSIMLGYHNQDAATRDVLDDDGWYHTGDLGSIDEHGNVFLRGRLRELIIRGGENIHPGEIEDILAGHDWIGEVAVVGREHPILGELPVAAVVCRQTLSDDEFTQRARESIAACRQLLAAYKVPEIVAVDTIPRTAMGKVKRYQLRDALPPRALEPLHNSDVEPDLQLAAQWASRLTAPHDGLAALRALLEDAMAGVLDLSADGAELDFNQPFGALGFTSMMGVQLRNRLVTATGLELPTAVVYDRPTPMALLRYIESLLTDAPHPLVSTSRPQVADSEPVAIIGMACRFPGGVISPEHLWELVAAGSDAIGPFPTDRGWDLDSLLNPSGGPGASVTASGGFLDNVADFDPQFFGVSPREALAMDPQQRLLLELAWEAAERAGIVPDSLRDSRTGVFAGMMFHDYGQGAQNPDLAGYRGIGVAGGVASGRIAYVLGLRGPALTVDTACSSALVAVHLAVRSLRSGECDMALAGGVAVMATPATFVEFSAQGGLSTDGRCKAFGAGADGTGWSEGAGLLMLQRLSDARRDGRRVLAVIEGSAINQDGASNGLAAPNGPAQEEVIRAALADAGITARDVDVVEAHGTGTMLGDPIEATALINTYGQDRDESSPILLGSLKSNIGHTQSAAGVGAIIKIVLALCNEQAPRTLHAEQPTSHVDWTAGSVQLLDQARLWPRMLGRVRRAGISAFGMGGTNAHLILAEKPTEVPNPQVAETLAVLPGGPVVAVVSARTDTALKASARALADTVAAADVDPAAVAHTLQTARTLFSSRGYLVAGTSEELVHAAVQLSAGRPDRKVISGTARAVLDAPAPVFVFSGQGSQRVGMGHQLAQASPLFASALGEIAELADAHTPRPLLDVMWSPGRELDQTMFAQPALFAIEVAVARILAALGATPAAVIGHSVGEIAAAHIAGVLSLPDAVKMVCARGALMQRLPDGGAMVAIAASESEISEVLDHDNLSLAAVNGERAVVISGPLQACERVAALFAARGRRTKRLAVSHAFHSALMTPMLDDFARVLDKITFHQPKLHCYPTAGTSGDYANPQYWLEQVSAPVRFAEAAAQAGLSATGFVEVGRGSVLTALINEALGANASAPAVAMLCDGYDEAEALCRGLISLTLAGNPIALDRLHGPQPLVDLPTYPFERKRFWLNPASHPRHTATGESAITHPVLTGVTTVGGPQRILITGQLPAATPGSWLAEHRIDGRAVLPGSALAELAMAAGTAVGTTSLTELVLQTPLMPADDRPTDIQVILDAAGKDYRVELLSRPLSGGWDTPWVAHATGQLSRSQPGTTPPIFDGPPADAQPIELERFYATRDTAGLSYGPAFQGLRSASVRANVRFAKIRLAPRTCGDGYGLHPALLDAALQAIDILDPSHVIRLPFSFGDMRIFARGMDSGWAVVTPLQNRDDAYRVELYDDAGTAIAEIGTVTLRVASQSNAPCTDGLYRLIWRPSDIDAESNPRVDAISVPHSDDVSAVLTEVLATLQQRSIDGPPLVVVTSGAIAVDSDELPDPTQAAVWGLVRSAQSEHPGQFHLVDLPPGHGDLDLTRLPDVPQLAIRGTRALVPRLARLEAPPDEIHGAAIAGQNNGTILITGGTGGLGAILAEHLAATHGVRRLILISRGGPDPETAAAITESLRTHGAHVEFAACDVSEPDDVEALLATVPDDHPITGVIHTAGVIDDAPLDSLTQPHLENVLAPKAGAIRILTDALASSDLDYMVVFSSAAGVFGNPGQANYAAANAYLDAYAQRANRHGIPITSIAWGLWDVSRGMAAGLSAAAQARNRRDRMNGLSAAHGMALFDRVTKHGGAVIAANLDLTDPAPDQPIPEILTDLVMPPLPHPLLAETRPGNDRQFMLAAADRDQRLPMAIALVRNILADVLGYASAQEIAIDHGFLELGIDSLTAVELRNRLNAATGSRLPATVAFDHPTIDALAQHICTLLATTDSADGPNDPKPPSHSLLSGSSLGEVTKRIAVEGDFDAAVEFLGAAARLRQRTQKQPIRHQTPVLSRLAHGPAPIVLVGIPTMMAPTNDFQYASLARHFSGKRDMWHAPLIGVTADEPLPNTFDDLLRVIADSIVNTVDSQDICLFGHSAGGIIAQAVAHYLNAAGAHLSGVILGDTYFFGQEDVAPQLKTALAAGLFANEALGSLDAARLTAIGYYAELVSQWEPTPLPEIPSLFLLPETGPSSKLGTRVAGQLCREEARISGDHFTMLTHNANSTASTVNRWLRNLES